MQAAGQTSRRAPVQGAQTAVTDRQTRTQPGTSVAAGGKRRSGKGPGRTRGAQDGGRDHGDGAPPSDGSGQLTPDEIRSALAAALASPEFLSAPQLRAFLDFIVRATLDGETDKLKGYTIAVEALGRAESFNPVTDPIVRVEAARLRRRLDKYYGGSGVAETVRIGIPKGNYAPEFYRVPPPKEAGPGADAGPSNQKASVVDLPLPPAGGAAAGLRDSAEAAREAGRGDERPGEHATPELRETGGTLADPVLPAADPAGFRLPAAFRVGTRSDLSRAGRHRLSPPQILMIACLCFLAGYLLASL